MAIVKTLTRVVVIGGLATGTAVLIAGPHRVGALFSQARHHVVTQIDDAIGDPVALRQNLRDLEAKYPKRIAEVRSELHDVRNQVQQLADEQAVAQRVVEMAMQDRDACTDLIDRAEQVRADQPYQTIRVRFDGQTLSFDEAYAKAAQINGTITAYSQRAEQAGRNINLLQDQEQRLGELLAKLETERAELQAQLWQLDAEIAMIERNEKLIDMTEKRQKTIDKYERFEVASIDQVRNRINKIRAEQEARLESLTNDRETTSYEDRARTMIEAEQVSKNLYESSEARLHFSTTPVTIGDEQAPSNGVHVVEPETEADEDPARVAAR
ncbi:MAG: hypothetical protein AAFX05_05670 [Planctomycetota bacterium]